MQASPENSSDIAVRPERRFIIRSYRPSDRARIRKICADTGFLSNPIDPVFEDRELFADYLTGYYTDCEPESTFVIERDNEVRGYLTGSCNSQRHAMYEMIHLPLLVARGLWRYFARPYNAATRKYIHWILTQSGKEQPFTPPDTPHFHINLLPDVRSVHETHDLVQAYLNYLVSRGERAVFGQIVTFGSRRGERMFARYGFKVIDQREVTKYRDIHDGQVNLFTVIKDLTADARLYMK